MIRKSIRAIMVLILVSTIALFSPPQEVHAATITWIGGTGDWSVDANWSPAVVPSGTEDILIDGDSETDSVVRLDISFTLFGSLTIDEDDTLEIDGELANLGTIYNKGDLENYGTIKNNGTINNYNNLYNGGTFENSGTIANEGDIANEGEFDNSGTIDNLNTINNFDLIDNSGIIDNLGIIWNWGGTIDNQYLGTIDNNSNIYNHGTINNDGAIETSDYILNSGVIENYGTCGNLGDIANEGVIENYGTFDNLGDIANEGGINNYGGTFNDQGVLAGNAVNHILSSKTADEIAVETEKAKVSWHPSEIELHGNLCFPEGIWMDTLTLDGSALITLAGVDVVDQSVVFEIKGKKGDKWEYKDKENVYGKIKEFKIDWKGAKFDYKGDDGFNIHTHFIGASETTLCIHTGYVSGAFTVTINGTTIGYDADRNITTIPTDLPYEPQKEDNSHVHFTLPFRLTSEMTIGVSGAVGLTIDVADYYKEDVAKFKVKAIFDPLLLPDGSATVPDELEYEISLGDPPVMGDDLIGVEKEWTKKDDKRWEYK